MKATGNRKAYLDAISHLDEKYPFLATHVVNLGSPSYSSFIPTAAIGLTKKGEGNMVISSRDIGFELILNRDFEKTLADAGADSYAFILAHESMHLLLGHLVMAKDFDDPMKFNIATDCIINDWLFNHGFTLDEAILQPCRGEFYVGFDASSSSVEEIYRLLPENLEDMFGDSGDSLVDDHGSNGSIFGPDGKPSSGGSGGDPNSGIPEMSDIEAEVIADKVEEMIRDHLDKTPDEMKDMLAESNDSVADLSGMVGGWSPTGFSYGQAAEAAGVKLDWVQLLNTIHPDLFTHGGKDLELDRSFARPHKKLMTVYPRAVLPGIAPSGGGFGGKGKGRTGFVLALDTSGSIPYEAQVKFQTLARSIPTDKANVYCCTFSTEYVEFDLESENNRIAQGGTAFMAVEQFVQDIVVPDLGKYPNSVVVITDGAASFDYYYGMRGTSKVDPPSDELLKNWHWLMLYANGRVSDGRVMQICADQIYPLDSFVN